MEESSKKQMPLVAPPVPPGELEPLDVEVVKRYLEKEKTSPVVNPEFLQKNNEQRLSRIKWINQIVIGGKMKLVTAYLATSYFNSAIASDQEAIMSYDLLSVASLFVALKFEESNGFEAHMFKLVEGAKQFETEDIFLAERELLDRIEWKGRLVTPFDYLSFFIKEFGTSADKMATFLICSDIIRLTTEGVLPLEFKPSVIAASAVIVALEMEHAMVPESVKADMNKEDLDKCCVVLRNMLRNQTMEDESPLKKLRKS